MKKCSQMNRDFVLVSYTEETLLDVISLYILLDKWASIYWVSGSY